METEIKDYIDKKFIEIEALLIHRLEVEDNLRNRFRRKIKNFFTKLFKWR